MKEQNRRVGVLAFQLVKESDWPSRVCWLAGPFVCSHPNVKRVREPFILKFFLVHMRLKTDGGEESWPSSVAAEAGSHLLGTGYRPMMVRVYRMEFYVAL